VVESGLEVGEKVVIDGLDRLRDGARVTLADAAPPAGTPGPGGERHGGGGPEQQGQGRHRRP
jgi:multidrug efflux system membrane fusion protein